MRLDRAERKFIRFAYTTPDTLTSAEVWLAGAWHPAELKPPEIADTTGDVEVFCAGPDADPIADPAPVILPLGVHVAKLRFPDVPEALVELAGWVIVE